MIKDVEVNGKLYEIDTTPPKFMGRSDYAKIVRFCERPATGPLARAISEMSGKPAVRREYYEVSPEEEREVVQVLDWKFSRSNSWRNLWEYWRMHGQGRTF